MLSPGCSLNGIIPPVVVQAINNADEAGHPPIDPLLAALGSLEEEHLSAQIIRPVLEKLHPGRLEYTHSGDEAGRDLISFGRDPLLPSRGHIFCVQVKARRISHGAASFGEVAAVAITAKTEGVTRENGERCIPNEVWFVTSHAFPEQKRRQVADTLQQLQRQNIKFIAGEELCAILRDQLPDLAATLLTKCSVEIMHFVSSLSKHHEGRAFGLSLDREVNTFYVSTAISTDTDLANSAVAGSLSVRDTTVIRTVPLLQLLNLDELDLPQPKRIQLVGLRVTRSAAKFPAGFPDVSIDANIDEILGFIDKAIRTATAEAQALVDAQRANILSKPISFSEALQARLADVKLDVVLLSSSSGI